MKTTVRLIAMIAAVALLGAGCTKTTKTGTGVQVGVNEDGTASAGLNITTTTAAPTTTTPKLGQTPTTQAKGATATTAKPATTTTAASQNESVIKIQDDEQGSYFDPPGAFAARVGSVVIWKNVGTKQARSIAAEDGSFVSPPIPPGGEFRWKVKGPARVIEYGDETRPYATAKLQVVS